MKHFKFDQHELGMHDSNDGEITHTRRAARAVMKNSHGKVAVMYFNTTGSYKLPGGGIDDGESTNDALVRELLEETGYRVSDVEELCTYEEWRYISGMHQISYCFTATATDFVGTQLTEDERSRGMELRWADDYEQAIQWIQSATVVDNDGSKIDLDMMVLRDSTIVHWASQQSA